LQHTYLVIDALDECVTGLDLLLRLVAQEPATHSSVKWIISSRNWPTIEERLNAVTRKIRLSLELNEKSISAAVSTYIQHKVDALARQKKYDEDTRDAVYRHLLSNANDTFLWVALVCQELTNVSAWKAQGKLMEFPPGLNALYGRMMGQICESDDVALCRSILAATSIVRRPITLDEMEALVEMPRGISGNQEFLAEIIGLCGSFLSLRERTISFVHQSAKDFLVQNAAGEIFPRGIQDVHHSIFSRSLQVMANTLRRDIYDLGAPGYPIDHVKQRVPDPLAAVRYPCVYWVDHLSDCGSIRDEFGDLQDGGPVDRFLRQSYLHWVEALSLLKSMSEGTLSMAKLDGLLQVRKTIPIVKLY
jgi:hypothetical protein